MPRYRFERECRTAHSEAYTIFDQDESVGRVDVHFTYGPVYAALAVGERLTQQDVRELIQTIDEELVLSADVPREDLVVTVYQGRELGIFTDEDFEEEEETNHS